MNYYSTVHVCITCSYDSTVYGLLYFLINIEQRIVKKVFLFSYTNEFDTTTSGVHVFICSAEDSSSVVTPAVNEQTVDRDLDLCSARGVLRDRHLLLCRFLHVAPMECEATRMAHSAR